MVKAFNLLQASGSLSVNSSQSFLPQDLSSLEVRKEGILVATSVNTPPCPGAGVFTAPLRVGKLTHHEKEKGGLVGDIVTVISLRSSIS